MLLFFKKNCDEWEEKRSGNGLILYTILRKLVKYINKIVVNDVDEIIEIQQYLEPFNKNDFKKIKTNQ